MRKQLLCLLLLSATFSIGQISFSFARHLSVNKLEREHRTYLNSFPISDSLNFLLSKFYIQYQKPNEFLSAFPSAQNLFTNDTNALHFAATFIVRQPMDLAAHFFSNDFIKNNSSATLALIRNTFNSASYPDSADTGLLPAALRKNFLTYKKYYNKKPFVAGLLSAVVPGLGKVYAGRRLSFMNTFLLHTFFVATGVEAVTRLGWKHPYTIVNLAYSGVFYLANIYGSYKEVDRVKKEKRQQYINDAADYFEFTGGGALYPSR